MIINMQSGGVVPERIIDEQTITPGTADQVLTAGTYLRGDLTVLGDADLIAANIPSDVNLFGIQGTRPPNYGANVWAKHIYLPEVTYTNPSLKLTAPSSSGKACLISNETFDLMRVDDYLTFFDGFKSTSSIVNDLVNTGTYLKWTNATVYARLGNFDPVNKQFTLSFDSSTFKNMVRTFVFDGDKTIQASGGDIVGFVVDDDPTAYPDGAAHTDGYWYELLGQVSSANVASLSDTTLMAVQQDYRDQIETEVSNANA